MTKNKNTLNRNDSVTEWLNLERLPENDLPLPRYESGHSAGVDFSACLTRPCRFVPEGASFKQSQGFVCCCPTQTVSYTGPQHRPITHRPAWRDNRDVSVIEHDKELHIKTMSNARLRVNPDDESWKEYKKANSIRLIIWPGETIMIPLGFKTEFGLSHVLMLHVRSSTGMRGLELGNNTGIIDPDYRGELWAVVYNRNKKTPIIVEHGDRLVQGVMLLFNQAIIAEANVDITDRGDGGFGSTGISVHSEDCLPPGSSH